LTHSLIVIGGKTGPTCYALVILQPLVLRPALIHVQFTRARTIKSSRIHQLHTPSTHRLITGLRNPEI